MNPQNDLFSSTLAPGISITCEVLFKPLNLSSLYYNVNIREYIHRNSVEYGCIQIVALIAEPAPPILKGSLSQTKKKKKFVIA